MGRPRLAEITGGPAVDWLFLDLNSYFASVEQQERPELRGKPMAVVPLITPNTVCIAASYEAKAHGVKTGTRVKDAQAICPGIALVEGRPQIYAAYHRAIFAAVERCLPVTTVMSIDEAACRLVGLERMLPNAQAIALSVKAAIREVGDTLRCSIGLAPNRLLAKVAADMQKPDGLTVLLAKDLPQALFGLKPGDLPGVGLHTQEKLAAAGVHTMEQFCALSSADLRRVFGSVAGARMWHLVRGSDFHEPESQRKSLGKQHVLAPELRTRAGAYSVSQKLLHTAATEVRHLNLWASGIGVAINFLDAPRGGAKGRARGPWVNAPSWKAKRQVASCRDIFTLQGHLAEIWKACPEGAPILVHVWLFGLVPDDQHSLSLFDGDTTKREQACAAMDALNQRFGAKAVYPGGVHAVRDAAPTRIPFSGIPGPEKF